MNFEDALKAVRKGKKIRHSSFADDEYLTACRIGLVGDDTPLDQRLLSIAKIKGDRQDDIMAGKLNYIAKIKKQLKEILTEKDYKKYHNFYTEMAIGKIFDNDIFNFPHINLFIVMSDQWEII